MFITLHDETTGSSFNVSVAHIVMYADHFVYTDTEDCYHVQETMREIAVQIALS